MKKYEINGKYVEITLNNDKIVKVEKDYLDNMVDTLEIDMDEAVLTYLEDEEYEINDEQEALTKKAKENHITATIHEAGDKTKARKKTERTVKENPTKEMLIINLKEKLQELEEVENIIIENKSKIITFSIGDKRFKLDLIERRKEK